MYSIHLILNYKTSEFFNHHSSNSKKKKYAKIVKFKSFFKNFFINKGSHVKNK